MPSPAHIDDSASLPRVFGRYLLVQRLSSGGMGEIFLAKHGLSGFEKLCVIKKVLPRLSADEHFISRFVDEAQVAIHLQHANIAQVFEVGRVGDEYFLALEYVEGRDLRRSLQVLAERNQRFPLNLALLIARDLANGLAYAHRRTGPDGEPLGVVHCDISPPNVLASFEGEIKVIDFGIAKSAVRGTDTDPKMGFGKFGYMAPEQLIRGGQVDHRADVYAAGTVLFELLTGARLYTAGANPDYRALAKKVIQGQHPRPSDLDPELGDFDDLVLRAVATRAKDRFQSAAELRDAIQQALVAVDPMVSSDALGLFMRDLFAEEMEAEQHLQARVRETDLSAWQALLARNGSSTVSFALVPDSDPDSELEGDPAALESGPVHHTPTAVQRRLSSDLGPPHRHASNPAVGEHAVTTAPARPSAGRGRTAWAIIAALASLIGGTAVAMLASQDASPRGEEHAAPPALDSKEPAGASTDTGSVTPVVAPLDTSTQTRPASGPGDDPGDDPEQTASAEEAPAQKANKTANQTANKTANQKASAAASRRATKRARRQRSASSRKSRRRRPQVETEPPTETEAPATLTRAEVETLFRAVNKEYRSFQNNYGARLADRWANLVHAIQYAQSPDKLRRVANDLRAFRAEMRRIKTAANP